MKKVYLVAVRFLNEKRKFQQEIFQFPTKKQRKEFIREISRIGNVQYAVSETNLKGKEQ